MAFLDEATAEGRDSDLGDSTVVEDLAADVLQVDAFSHVSLEEQVATLVEAAVETMVIGLAEGSLDLHL